MRDGGEEEGYYGEIREEGERVSEKEIKKQKKVREWGKSRGTEGR